MYEPKTSATGRSPAKSASRTRSPLGRCVSGRGAAGRTGRRGRRARARRHQPPVERRGHHVLERQRRVGRRLRLRPISAQSERSSRRRCCISGDGTFDLPDEPEPAHQPDHEPADVELPGLQAVERRGGEGVVVVVPGLAERDPREPPDVARLVLDAEAARADEVADRVDRPRDVVEQEDPDQAAPEQRLQPGAERAAPEPAGGEREQQRAARPRARTSARRRPCRGRRAGPSRTSSTRRGRRCGRASRRARARGPRSCRGCPGPKPACGECGSPSRSAKLWCLRWSETQRITGPCTAIEPSTARP